MLEKLNWHLDTHPAYRFFLMYWVTVYLMLFVMWVSGPDQTKAHNIVVPKPIVQEDIHIEEMPTETESPVTEIPDISEDDISLIALVTMAEAEGESELGQRLVIDTILNRKDHECFPDTVYEVVYQPNQFTSMTNGRVDRCYVKEDIVQLVREELISRTNSDVVFFRTQRYSSYGNPLFQEGNHYFSSY